MIHWAHSLEWEQARVDHRIDPPLTQPLTLGPRSAHPMAAHQIYFHLTWSTFRRQPMIDAPTHAFLDQYFRRIVIQERVTLVAAAFLRTHVHLLLHVGPRYDLSRLVQLLKGGSSHAASRQPGNLLGLRWNREYSVASVSPRLVNAAIAYIQGQDRRHPTEAISTAPQAQ